MDYKKKYLKYKLKYENLIGGADKQSEEQTSYFGSLFGSLTGTNPTPPQSVSPPTQVDEQGFQMVEQMGDIKIGNKQFMYGSNKIDVELICCGDILTVFPERVSGCEASMTHKALGAVAYVKAMESSFDAIVKIVNNNEKNTNLKILSQRSEVINKINYMSDHNAICTRLFEPKTNFKFNLVSFNMEGLCDRNAYPGEYERRLELLEIHLSTLVTPGFIMATQELVLQSEVSQLKPTGENISYLLNNYLEYKNGLRTIKFISDGFTGGIFFDSSIWDLFNVVEIPRNESKPRKKKSNFYLFKHTKIPNLNIGVVNIHLKAPTPGAYFNLVEKQRLELQNILKKINTVNPGFAIPVYLCGDYNNNENKALQILNSTKKLVTDLSTRKTKLDPDLSIFFDQKPIF